MLLGFHYPTLVRAFKLKLVLGACIVIYKSPDLVRFDPMVTMSGPTTARHVTMGQPPMHAGSLPVSKAGLPTVTWQTMVGPPTVTVGKPPHRIPIPFINIFLQILYDLELPNCHLSKAPFLYRRAICERPCGATHAKEWSRVLKVLVLHNSRKKREGGGVGIAL